MTVSATFSWPATKRLMSSSCIFRVSKFILFQSSQKVLEDMESNTAEILTDLINPYAIALDTVDK